MSLSGMLGYGLSEKTTQQRGTTTTNIAMPAPSAAEVRLQELQSKIAELQYKQMQDAAKAQADYEESPLAGQQKELEKKATANLLARLTGKATLSPEEQAYLDQIYGSAQAEGSRDIRQFAENLAASRGMTLTDTPIGGEALRQERYLTQGLQGQRATSALNLGSANADFNLALTQFREGLRQQAQMNRLNLAGLQPGYNAFASNLLSERLGGRGTATRTTGMENTFGWNADTKVEGGHTFKR